MENLNLKSSSSNVASIIQIVPTGFRVSPVHTNRTTGEVSALGTENKNVYSLINYFIK